MANSMGRDDAMTIWLKEMEDPYKAFRMVIIIILRITTCNRG